MRVAVTGAFGFVGREMVAALTAMTTFHLLDVGLTDAMPLWHSTLRP